MSHVSNVILSFSVLENEEQRMQEINKYLLEVENQQFENADFKVGDRFWYGGHKVLETPLWVGAFNYLHIGDLLQFMQGVSWDYPDEVQLIVKDQHSDIFKILTLDDWGGYKAELLEAERYLNQTKEDIKEKQ